MATKIQIVKTTIGTYSFYKVEMGNDVVLPFSHSRDDNALLYDMNEFLMDFDTETYRALLYVNNDADCIIIEIIEKNTTDRDSFDIKSFYFEDYENN